MIEDMAMRGLRSDTQRDYIRVVRSFAAFLGRSLDTAQAEDIRRFQVHQRESGVQPPTWTLTLSKWCFCGVDGANAAVVISLRSAPWQGR